MKEFYVKDRAHYEVISGKFWLVEVVEVKRAYGNVRYVIQPVGGGDKITTERLTAVKK